MRQPTTITSADLDGDGDPDLICGSRGPGICWFEKRPGVDSFSALKVIAPGDYELIVSGDLDGDGDADIAAARTSDSELLWLENSGRATFGAPQSLGTFALATKVLVADVDGDEIEDVVAVSGWEGKIIWIPGGVDGPTGEHRVISTQANRLFVAGVADVDDNGTVDVFGHRARNTLANGDIVWYPNLGNGRFGGELFIYSGPVETDDINACSSVAVGDLDLDGQPDVISAWRRTLFGGRDAIYVHRGLGGGTFAPRVTLTLDVASPYGLHVVELAGDPRPDILVSSSSEDELYLLVPDRGLRPIGPAASGLSTTDIDEDGNLDLIVAARFRSIVGWHRNLGRDEGFTGRRDLTPRSFPEPWTVAVGDIDGDGDNDVVSATYGGGYGEWFENVGGRFDPAGSHIVENASYPRKISAADLDGDGWTDLVVSCDGGTSVLWYRNMDGRGRMGDPIPLDPDYQGSQDHHVFDADHDGDLDVVASRYGLISFIENLEGPEEFAAPTVLHYGRGYPSFDSGDLDGDARDDLVIVDSQNVLLYESSGSGLAGDPRVLLTGNSYGAVECADIDRDGDLDLVLLEGRDTVLWLENAGIGEAFGPEHVIDQFPAVTTWRVARTTDVDRDGDLDVIVGLGRGGLVWYENRGDGLFAPARPGPGRNTSIPEIDVGDLDGDGWPDLVTAVQDLGEVTWYSNRKPREPLTVQSARISDDADGPRITSELAGSSSAHDLRLQLPSDARRVDLTVLDVGGRVVRRLDAKPEGGREQVIRWDGRDRSGAPAGSGVYFVRLDTDRGSDTAKLVRIR